MKGLRDHNLRDHMSEAELIFTALAELSTRQNAETDDTTGMSENKVAATQGGAIARQARKARESKTGRSVACGQEEIDKLRWIQQALVESAWGI